MTDISLGESTIETNLTGYDTLIDFYDRCNGHKGNDSNILIDFQKLTAIDANMSAILMAMLNKLNKEKGLIFFVDYQLIGQKFPALIRNGWVTRSGLELIPSANRAEVRLNGFYKGEDVRFLKFIKDELMSHSKLLLLKESDKKELTDAFLELFTNIENHAGVDMPIFACGQYLPQPARLCFTLVDTGVGYLPPIKKFTNGSITTAKDAILWALEGNSSKTDAPGGLGLKMIQKFCQESGSRFEIITGGEYWTNYQLFPISVKPFCGTIVNVIFDCTYL